MKTIFFITSNLFAIVMLSQQQQQISNLSYQGNSNPPAVFSQTNVYNSNDDNNFENKIEQQVLVNNVGNYIQISNNNNNNNAIKENDVSAEGNNFSFSLNVNSRSSSGSSSSSKFHKHTLSKKMKKFNRNFYGKMASHKKSKHLVDVCFNWSK